MPLYFSWIFFISGWINCIPREALICLTKSGMSRTRIRITSPTIDSAHVHPLAAGNPRAEKALWNATMIQATTYSSGRKIALK